MNSKLMHLAALMTAVAALSACERKTTVVNPPATAPSSTTVVPVPVPGPAGSPGMPGPSGATGASGSPASPSTPAASR